MTGYGHPRRAFLRATLALPAILLLGNDGLAQGLRLTPGCADKDDATLPQTAGPFYKPSSPKRTSLVEPGVKGSRILLRGHVRNTRCQPIGGALVDFWQADAAGMYDNIGYRLRGHQYTQDSGHYFLETIVPGLYPGRTRHFHVRVQAPKGGPVLTTQLYFPGEPQNQRDGIFNEKLLLDVDQSGSEKLASFDFVIA